MEINNLMFHCIVKENGKVTSYKNPNKDSVKLESSVSISFVNKLHTQYKNRCGKGYGCFSTKTDLYPMKNIIDDYNAQKNDFYDLTVRMIDLLSKKIEDSNGATGGKIFIVEYKDDSSRKYILVAVLSEKTSYSASEQYWKLNEQLTLDIDDLKYSGLIDIDKYKESVGGNDKGNYISFAKGKDNEISKYFKEFLGCEDVLISKNETAKLVDVLKTFARSVFKSDSTKQQEFKRNALDQLKNCVNNGNAFLIDTFANQVFPDNPLLLIERLNSEGIPNNFMLDNRSLSKITRYEFVTKYWSIKFEDEAKNNGDLELIDGKKVVINNPSLDLIQALS